jgi:hypothetical protein
MIADKAKTANNSIASMSSIAYKNLSSVDGKFGRQSNEPNSVIVHRKEYDLGDQGSDDIGSYKAFST